MAKTMTKTRRANTAARRRALAKPKPKQKLMPKPRPKPAAAKKAASRAAKRSAPRRPRAPIATDNGTPANIRPIPADVPAYDQLPIRDGAPAGAAWGVFGDDDQLGTINLLTPQRVMQ